MLLVCLLQIRFEVAGSMETLSPTESPTTTKTKKKEQAPMMMTTEEMTKTVEPGMTMKLTKGRPRMGLVSRVLGAGAWRRR